MKYLVPLFLGFLLLFGCVQYQKQPTSYTSTCYANIICNYSLSYDDVRNDNCNFSSFSGTGQIAIGYQNDTYNCSVLGANNSESCSVNTTGLKVFNVTCNAEDIRHLLIPNYK